MLKKFPQISESEFEVMKIVWDNAPVNTNQITDMLVNTTKWSPKTVQTLIRRLVEKGALSYEKQGRVFVYTPAVEEAEYLKEKSFRFIEQYFGGDVGALISAYAGNEGLSGDEIESITEILERQGNSSESRKCF